jgi:transposase
MFLHANAKLGLGGRLALVAAIEGGLSLRAAAAAFNVSPATAHRWWHRWLRGGRRAEALLDRSSRPHRSPRLLPAELQERICACRRKTGWGPRLVGGATGFAHSTVWKVLKRAGLSRRPKAAKEPANRYEWPCPGDLLHMDVSRYARFERPGHRVTGDRSQRSRNWMRPETRVGYDYAHALVDVDRPRFGGQQLVRQLVVLPLSSSRSRPATGSRALSGALSGCRRSRCSRRPPFVHRRGCVGAGGEAGPW